jgi:xanthine dehydrogenase small subunit
MIHFLLNDITIQTPLPPGTTVLDFVRYHRHLMGTKIGCREGDCGACTVLVGELRNGELHYQTMTSCLMPLANAQGKHIVTIEGLNMKELSPVQQAIVEEGGSQCGFCTVGFVVSLTGFVVQQANSDFRNLEDFGNLVHPAIAAMDGNICRCTGYKPLERAALKIAAQIADIPAGDRLRWLVGNRYLPAYFTEIKSRLEALPKAPQPPVHTNGQAVITGGGTDLFVQKPEAMEHAPVEPFFDKKSLNEIREEVGNCYIGASTTAEDLQSSPLLQRIFPRIRTYMKLVSSTPIRNMGTLGGNLVNASPIGDLTIFFLALDSSIVLNKNGNRRTLKLRHFYKGYKTLDKTPDEFLETIFFNIPGENARFNFEKVSKRTHLDIASVNSACLLHIQVDTIQDAHVSVGGVSPVPLYLEKTSASLRGREVNAEMLRKAAAILQEEIAPISDARGSADYKRLLARQLFFAHFMEMGVGEVNWDELIGNT